MSEIQTCYACGQDKDLSLFDKRLGIPLSTCKQCVKEARQGKIITDLYAKRHLAKRKKRLMQATPKWLTEDEKNEIKRIKKIARENKMTVDHIVPLQGKNVSGLNVPWNLRILPKSENSKKYNTWYTL